MTTINEQYYGIRMGDPRRHRPFLWVNGGNVPVLFINRKQADLARNQHLPGTPNTAVVRVKITT